MKKRQFLPTTALLNSTAQPSPTRTYSHRRLPSSSVSPGINEPSVERSSSTATRIGRVLSIRNNGTTFVVARWAPKMELAQWYHRVWVEDFGRYDFVVLFWRWWSAMPWWWSWRFRKEIDTCLIVYFTKISEPALEKSDQWNHKEMVRGLTQLTKETSNRNLIQAACPWVWIVFQPFHPPSLLDVIGRLHNIDVGDKLCLVREFKGTITVQKNENSCYCTCTWSTL